MYHFKSLKLSFTTSERKRNEYNCHKNSKTLSLQANKKVQTGQWTLVNTSNLRLHDNYIALKITTQEIYWKLSNDLDMERAD